MPIDRMAHSLLVFLLAGLCEIGGGWLMWQWLRDHKPLWWGVAGGLVLVLYGIIPTLQPSHFGRVYAAYGVFLSSYLLSGVGSSMEMFQTDLT